MSIFLYFGEFSPNLIQLNPRSNHTVSMIFVVQRNLKRTIDVPVPPVTGRQLLNVSCVNLVKIVSDLHRGRGKQWRPFTTLYFHMGTYTRGGGAVRGVYIFTTKTLIASAPMQ